MVGVRDLTNFSESKVIVLAKLWKLASAYSLAYKKALPTYFLAALDVGESIEFIFEPSAGFCTEFSKLCQPPFFLFKSESTANDWASLFVVVLLPDWPAVLLSRCVPT